MRSQGQIFAFNASQPLVIWLFAFFNNSNPCPKKICQLFIGRYLKNHVSLLKFALTINTNPNTKSMDRIVLKTNAIVCFVVVLFAFLFKFTNNFGQKMGVNSKYKSWIRTNTSSINQPGYLYAAEAESILFMSYYETGSGEKKLMRQEVNYGDINRLQVRKRGSVGKGALIGAVAGAAIGALVGYNTTPEDDFFGKEGVALMAAIIITPIGAVAGSVIGSIRKPIMIDKNPVRYGDNALDLQKYAIEKRATLEAKPSPFRRK